jgi:hypothetical protein
MRDEVRDQYFSSPYNPSYTWKRAARSGNHQTLNEPKQGRQAHGLHEHLAGARGVALGDSLRIENVAFGPLVLAAPEETDAVEGADPTTISATPTPPL